MSKEPGYNGADLIVHHGEGQLWQGDRIDGQIALLGYIECRSTLKQTPIDMVILTAEEWPPDNTTKQLSKVTGYFVPLDDCIWKEEYIAKTLPKLQEVAAKGAKAVEEGKVVLICCAQGMNRSALIMGLLLKKLGYSGETAVKLIRAGRGSNSLNNWRFREIVEGKFDGVNHG